MCSQAEISRLVSCERQRLVEEVRVARAEAVLAGREQQPEVEVVRGAEVEARAQRPGAVRDEAVRHLGLELDRVAQDLARQLGLRVGDRQQVVQPAAVAAG